ncbi:MAG: preprotein translocase subunit SecG [Clostridia bacterium]|nr:preprotein translocase subunit SecG [Clostridia bacterium]
MLNLTALLAPAHNNAYYNLYFGLSLTLIILMFVSALTAIILVLMQPSNSSGIDALGGSSETFFGKNKGKSIEAKMKKWTWICLAILVVLSVIFFILQKDSIWV